MEFFAILGALLIFFLISGWRKSHVIQGATDTDLMNELKRRAFSRKMQAEASAEVENAVNHQSPNIPF